MAAIEEQDAMVVLVRQPEAIAVDGEVLRPLRPSAAPKLARCRKAASKTWTRLLPESTTYTVPSLATSTSCGLRSSPSLLPGSPAVCTSLPSRNMLSVALRVLLTRTVRPA